MFAYIVQNFVIACFIATIGVIASRLLSKLAKSIKFSFVSQVLEEVTSDCKRGIFAVSVVYFFATIMVFFTDLKPDFIAKNLLSGLVLIFISVIISITTIGKENITDFYENRANLSDKDKSITLTLIPIVASILRYLNVSISILTILSIWGVNIAPVLSGTAIVLAVFGFAGQSILQDLLGFGTLIIDRPFYVGSEIEFVFDFGSERGLVKEITLRNTIIANAEGYLFYIPNRDAKNFRVWKR